jgi:hypothetical protein
MTWLGGLMSRNESINTLLARIARRAEMSSSESLARTFVEITPVAASLALVDHQIVYGRRGTGKTHTLQHLLHSLERDGDLPLYVDLRVIGSSNAIYGDPSQSLTTRGTRLLIDVLEAVHSALLAASLTRTDCEAMLDLLDGFAEAATQVRVDGRMSAEEEHEAEATDASRSDLTAGARVAPAPSLRISGSTKSESSRKRRNKNRTVREGVERPYVHFGSLARALASVTDSISPRRVWLLLDEWSSVPLDLQPLLADLLRRSAFTCRNITIKIGANERRSRFFVRGGSPGEYLGLELGADTAAALNLDEHLLYQEDVAHAQDFFARLIFYHINDLLRQMGKRLPEDTPASFIADVFQPHAFAEWVRSAEGVPRDALNILGLAASRAGKRKVTVDDVQVGARQYYLRDKEGVLAGNGKAEHAWKRIQEEVVHERRSRTFLLKRSRTGPPVEILDLYDARLIHLLKPGLMSRMYPGESFDGYGVDYGTCVDALAHFDLDTAWSASITPWTYRKGEAVLPDRFDSTVIFEPDARSR